MRYGVTMFATDVSIDVVELARATEERGLGSLWLPEHTHIPASRMTPYPGSADGVLPEEYRRSLDPLVGLAAAAVAAPTLRLGTGILLPAQRDPIVTAKAVASLDHVSGGRVALGVGYGWNEDEMADHGVEYRQRRAVVPRARPRHAGAVAGRRSVVRGRARVVRAVLVVAQARPAGRLGPALRPGAAGRGRGPQGVRRRRRARRRLDPHRRRRHGGGAAPPAGGGGRRGPGSGRTWRSSPSSCAPSRASSTTTTRSASPRPCSGCPPPPGTRCCACSTATPS